MDEPRNEKRIARLEIGEAWMMCGDCGAKLYSFDGTDDACQTCPYRDNRGKCSPPRPKN